MTFYILIFVTFMFIGMAIYSVGLYDGTVAERTRTDIAVFGLVQELNMPLVINRTDTIGKHTMTITKKL